MMFILDDANLHHYVCDSESVTHEDVFCNIRKIISNNIHDYQLSNHRALGQECILFERLLGSVIN